MRMASLRLAALLLLASCAAHQAAAVRHEIVGRSVPDAVGCLGVPQHAETEADGTLVQEWDYTVPSSTASIPLAAIALLPVTLPLSLTGSFSTQETGSCRAIVRSRAGTVTGLIFAGASNSIGGADAHCGPIIKGCWRAWK